MKTPRFIRYSLFALCFLSIILLIGQYLFIPSVREDNILSISNEISHEVRNYDETKHLGEFVDKTKRNDATEAELIRGVDFQVSNPLNRYLVEIHRRNLRDDTRYTGVIGPYGGGGTGNQHFALSNMIMYSIFTNSSLIIPQSRYFRSNLPFYEFIEFIDPELKEYVVFPSSNEKVKEVWSKTKNNCDFEEKNDTEFSLLERWFQRKRIIRPYHPYQDPSFQEEFFTNEATKEKLYHPPGGGESYDVVCFPTHLYGFTVHDVFQSKTKTDFLCDTLQLCDGIDRERVVQNCRTLSVKCQHFGYILLRNIIRSLFKLSDDKYLSIMGEEREEPEDNEIQIGFHVRTVFSRIAADELGMEQCGHCIGRVLSTIKEKGYTFQKDGERRYSVFLAGDAGFNITDEFADGIFRVVEEHYPGLYDDISFHYYGGKKYVRRMPASPSDESVNSLFVDLYNLAKSDYLVASEHSTFANMIASFGDAVLNNRIFFLYRSLHHSYVSDEGSGIICSDKVPPFYRCSPEECPDEYIG